MKKAKRISAKVAQQALDRAMDAFDEKKTAEVLQRQIETGVFPGIRVVFRDNEKLTSDECAWFAHWVSVQRAVSVRIQKGMTSDLIIFEPHEVKP